MSGDFVNGGVEDVCDSDGMMWMVMITTGLSGFAEGVCAVTG